MFETALSGSVTDWRSGETWDASRLRAHARARTSELLANGAGPGKRVIITHGSTPAFFGDLFGVWGAGACAVCLNPATTPPELEVIEHTVEPVASLSGTGVPDQAAKAETHSRPYLDDDALILFTSGTTGTPKGVVHTFRSLLARLSLNQSHITPAELQRTLCVLPTHFGHGLIGNCLTALLGGHDLVLAPASNMDVPPTFGEIIDHYGITFLSSVPTFWQRVLKSASRPEKKALSRVHIGSAPLSSPLWMDVAEWCGTRNVWNMYGITETANWSAGASLEKYGSEDGLIGQMWGGMAAVVAPDGDVRTKGEGEIILQTPSVMRGYFEQPAMTDKVVKKGWYHTGDIGRIDEHGIMRLTGRSSTAINRGGLKVYPEDIDILLERHEAVKEACAFAVPDEIEGETIGVAVVLNDGVAIDQQELRRWCAARLSREKIPTTWIVTNEIPRNDRGKINRMQVASVCLSGEPASR